MICFRDMSFCSAACGNAKCWRRFTADTQAAADRWWAGCKGPAPIAFADHGVDCPDFTPDLQA